MSYYESDLVRIAKRENNTKRSYLVVNPLQGKHVPVSPAKALKMFESLAEKVKDQYRNETLLVVGFAETATAIGAQAAISLETKYIQTTREIIPGAEYLFFSEEHSHATEQKLVKNDIDEVVNDIDRILFIEDEVTTGNTILNIIRILRKEYEKELKFAVASLLNGMTSEYQEIYEQEKINIHYLVKTDHSAYSEAAEKMIGDGKYFDVQSSTSKIDIINIKGAVNSRRIIDSKLYLDACKELSDRVIEKIHMSDDKKILVLGTEECMYPAIYTGSRIEENGYEVKTHSTTRSPVMVSNESDYPLHQRFALQSVYDPDRKTFIYDIDQYDQVIVITDSEMNDMQGVQSLVNALKMKNSKISIFRWC